MTTTTPTQGHKPRIFCADDNPLVSEALKRYIDRSPDFAWMGCTQDADHLCQEVRVRGCPDIVLLDIDMPGMDPFEAIGTLQGCCSITRVLMYSGMVTRELIDRAIESGAWGYVAKSDGENALFDAMRKVLAGELGLSPEAQSIFGG